METEYLRNPLPIKSIDIRKALSVSPSTLTDIYKKCDIKYNETGGPKRGSGKSVPGTEVRKILESRGFKFNEKAEVISFYICKGGVGKTTSAFYLGQRLSEYGAKVLLIDADPQGNLTSSFDLEDFEFEIDDETPILVDLYEKKANPEEVIIKYTQNLHLIPSTPLNSTLEGSIRNKSKSIETVFGKIVDPLKGNYDYIIIDCAPALNLTNACISAISDLVILPVSPDKFSTMGLKQTLEDLADNEEAVKHKIKQKILFTRFDQRERNSIKYLAEVNEDHADILMNTTIRVAADVRNAMTNKEHLFDYKRSSAKEDYDAFAREIMGLDKFFEKNPKVQ